MNPTLSLHIWCSYSNELRHRLRVIFNIPRSSGTVVNDGVIEISPLAYMRGRTFKNSIILA